MTEDTMEPQDEAAPADEEGEGPTQAKKQSLITTHTGDEWIVNVRITTLASRIEKLEPGKFLMLPTDTGRVLFNPSLIATIAEKH